MATFDRTPGLTQEEKSALANWITHIPSPPKPAIPYYRLQQQKLQLLHRLVDPVQEAITYCKYHDTNQKLLYSCCALLLKEMHVRQTAMWAWDKATWVEIVGYNTQHFQDRHHAFLADWLNVTINLRPCIMNCAYLFGEIDIHLLVTDCDIVGSAKRIFGKQQVWIAEGVLEEAFKEKTQWSYLNIAGLSSCLCLALLRNRNPQVEKLTLPVLEQVYANPVGFAGLQPACVQLYHILRRLRIVTEAAFGFAPLELRVRKDGLPEPLGKLLDRWLAKYQGRKSAQPHMRSLLAKMLRYVVATYPNRIMPSQWTANMARRIASAISKMRTNEWTITPPNQLPATGPGKEYAASTKAYLFSLIRSFLNDGQDYNFFTLTFEPDSAFRTPRNILNAVKPYPKALSDANWEKLEQAGMSLTQEDLLSLREQADVSAHEASYPLTLVRAIALVWLFGGLRTDEIVRLPLGCIRPLPSPTEEEQDLWQHVCLLHVPVNKSCGEFDKPVEYYPAEAIQAWEAERPAGPQRVDETTGELVDFLFEWEGRGLIKTYLNRVLIPLLCRKAQLDMVDEKGPIRSHRARVTLATRYYKAGLGLEELRLWLGHLSILNLRYYLDVDDDWLNQSASVTFHAIRRRAHQVVNRPSELVPTEYALEDADSNLSVAVENEEELIPDNFLAHLFFKPQRSKRAFISAVHESITAMQRNVHLSSEELRIVYEFKDLLEKMNAHS